MDQGKRECGGPIVINQRGARLPGFGLNPGLDRQPITGILGDFTFESG